jgi:hypothetical protein
MKKYRGDEPVSVIIHTYMEMSQRNSLFSYLKQVKISFFSFFLLQNQRTGGQNRSCGRGGWVGTSGRGKMVGKGCRKLNMVLCSHVKMILVKTISKNG